MPLKPVLRTYAVEKPGAFARVSSLDIFPDHIRLGSERFPYAGMVSRRLQDGCIRFWQGERTVCFAAQGAISRGGGDPELTAILNELMDALAAGDSVGAANLVATVRKGRSVIAAYSAVVVAYIFMIAAVFGIFSESILRYPWLLAVLAVAGFLGPLGIMALPSLAPTIIAKIRKRAADRGSGRH